MLGGVGVAMWIAEAAEVSNPPFYGLSNAMLFAACATIWNGARLFYGRKVLPWALAAGPVVWLVACQTPFFAQSGLYRIILSSLIASSTRGPVGRRHLYPFCMVWSFFRQFRWQSRAQARQFCYQAAGLRSLRLRRCCMSSARRLSR
jgi:hypothetical protein